MDKLEDLTSYLDTNEYAMNILDETISTSDLARSPKIIFKPITQAFLKALIKITTGKTQKKPKRNPRIETRQPNMVPGKPKLIKTKVPRLNTTKNTTRNQLKQQMTQRLHLMTSRRPSVMTSRTVSKIPPPSLETIQINQIRLKNKRFQAKMEGNQPANTTKNTTNPSQCLICSEICIDKGDLARHHHQNHPYKPCPLSCWTCGLMFKTDSTLKTHFKTVRHLLKAKEFQVDHQQTDFIFQTMDPTVRYHSYIQPIDQESLPTDYSYQYNTRILKQQPAIIPLEPINPGNPPTDPRIYRTEPSVSEEESLQVMKFLEEFEEFDSTMNYKNPVQFPIKKNEDPRKSHQKTDWIIIDTTGNTENPAMLIPPEDFDFFDLVEL